MSLRRSRWFSRKPVAAVAALALTLGLAAAPARAAEEFPFRDPALPLGQRIDDLLGRLTPDEKIMFLHQYQPAVDRLGIKLFKAGTEALHGLAWSNDTQNGNQVYAAGTVFPQAVGLASTWDPDLIKKVGSVVGDEARGYNSENSAIWGLNVWSPVVNLLRDPRWGRNEEGYSEDPTLTGAISTAYGSGLQGDDPRYLKTAPTLKHYLANNNEIRRDTASSNLRPRVKHEYDEAAFKPAISADAATGVMGAYNLVNGRPLTVSPDYNDVVRKWTDKTLFNVSDAFAPYNLTGSQQYFATQTEANAALLKAGLDSFTFDGPSGDHPGPNYDPLLTTVKDALAKGLIAESDIDTAVGHALSIRFRLGEFDPGGGPYGKITMSVVNSPESRRLARRTAAEAMVLLKNANRALPLDAAKTKKVAVVGPLADTLYVDWYSGTLPYKVTPLDGITERLGGGATVTGTEGVDRIALKEVSSGRYVTAGTGAAGAALKVSGTEAGDPEKFDVFDWGQGVLTLRSAANGKYVGYNWSTFNNDQEQPNGWFVMQQFKLEQQPDGSHVIRYVGYEKAFDWSGPNHYVTVGEDGTLALGAPTAAQAARFTKETVSSGAEQAVAAAKDADAAIVVVGSMPFINGREDHDRTDMNLAEGQQALVDAVRQANPNTVVVLENSYPTTINRLQETIPGIVWTTHAGAETGHALADVLFGDVNPAGRLTQTWYRSADDLPDILEYDIIKTDRTYLYFKGTPLYPFGHGLSYSSFRYGTPRLSASSVGAGGTATVSVDVTNTGKVAGDEVVQLYTHQRASRDKQPVKQLRAFERVDLEPGQTKTVRLRLRAADLAHWDVTRSRPVVEDGTYDLMVGASSADIRGRATLRVRGERIPARDLSEETRVIDFDDYSGVTLVDESKVRGDAVGGAAGAWVKFADADLGRGVSRFTAKAAKASPGEASVQIRLDSPTGRLVGTAAVASTGDVYAYAPVSATLDGAGGRHDVYLVYTGDFRLSTFALTG